MQEMVQLHSTLLAREMVKAGLEQLDNGANAVDIKRGIDNAVEQVITQLRTLMKIFLHLNN